MNREKRTKKKKKLVLVVARAEKNEGAEVGVCATADLDVEQKKNAADWGELEKKKSVDAAAAQGCSSLDAYSNAADLLLHLSSIQDFSSFSDMTATAHMIPQEEEDEDVEKAGSLLTMEELEEDMLFVETQRKKKSKSIWRGQIRVRQMPPQLPWSEEDCRQRVETIVGELLRNQRHPSSDVVEGHTQSITNVLNSWAGKITRVDLSNIIKELGSRQEGALAFEVFSWMQQQRRRLKPNGHTYSSMIGVLGRVGMVSEAQEVFDSMLSFEVPRLVYTYNAMIGAYGRIGNFNKAWRLYEDMVLQGIHADEITFNTLLSAVGRAGLPIEKAEKVFLSMKRKGFLCTGNSYNMFLSVLSKVGYVETASNLMHEMCHLTDATPDLVSYNTLLTMYARAGKHKEGIGVFTSLRAAGLQPNVVTFTGLIQLYSCACKHQEAIKTFLEMKRSGCCPDLTTYSLMVSVYGKAGLVEEASQVFRRMQADGFKPNVVAWSSIIQAYGRHGMLQEVGKHYNEMLATGCQPDVTLYNILLGSYGREGYSVQAAILFRKMSVQGIAPDAVSYNIMIQTYCRAKQLADAHSVYDQMTQAGFSPDKITKVALQQAGLKYTTENRIHLSRKERGIRWTPKLLRRL
ncbi:unnamed protein product [Sphagnum tenellum]